MSPSGRISRRKFVQSATLASAASVIPGLRRSGLPFTTASARSGPDSAVPLDEFSYADVVLDSALHEQQLQQTHAVLMELSDDSLLRPFRQMIGQPAPGEDLGGWYRYDPNYDWHTFDSGFAPSANFGQWVSALSPPYAITGAQAAHDKVLRLNRLYPQTIDGQFYENNR